MDFWVWLNEPLLHWPVVLTPFKMIGLGGAVMFAARWIVQAYYSRKAGRPVTPLLFWIMSIAGSAITFMYFLLSPKQDIVGIVNSFFPAIIAVYNLVLEVRYQKRVKLEAEKAREAEAAASEAERLRASSKAKAPKAAEPSETVEPAEPVGAVSEELVASETNRDTK